MNFLVDAQLPKILSEVFQRHGCNCIYVTFLPFVDRTKDKDVQGFADDHQRILITEDFDFYHSHMGIGKPEKLLLVTTGNITNRKLIELFEKNLPTILKAFDNCNFVELSNKEIIAL